MDSKNSTHTVMANWNPKAFWNWAILVINAFRTREEKSLVFFTPAYDYSSGFSQREGNIKVQLNVRNRNAISIIFWKPKCNTFFTPFQLDHFSVLANYGIWLAKYFSNASSLFSLLISVPSGLEILHMNSFHLTRMCLSWTESTPLLPLIHIYNLPRKMNKRDRKIISSVSSSSHFSF